MMKELNDAFERFERSGRKDALPPAARLRQVILALKQTIETVYRGGIDALLSFDMEGDRITGKFRDANQVYDYEISSNDELSYVESGVRSDAYLLGYLIDSGLSRGQNRQDAPVPKKRQCLQGKPCGNTCIAKGIKCRVKLAPPVRARLKQVRAAIATLPEREPAPASDPATSPAQVQRQFKVPPSVAVGAVAGAALLGLPIASYMAFRAKYRNDFKASATQAKKEAKGFEDYVPEDLKGGWAGRNGKPAEQMTFIVGGFAQEGGRNSLKWAEQFEGKDGAFDNHHVVPLSNEDFELPDDATGEPVLKVGDQTLLSDRNVGQFRMMLGTALERGRNPSAVRMAAAVYAYHQKHPDKPINLMGYSAGGMVTHEAAEVLKEMGVKNVRVANFGSPHWGLTEKVGPSVTFGSINDPGLGNVPVRDRVNVNSVRDHFSYLKDKEVRRSLQQFFAGKELKTEQPSFLPNSVEQARMTPEERKKAERRQKAAERAIRMKAKREGKQDSYQHTFEQTLAGVRR